MDTDVCKPASRNARILYDAPPFVGTTSNGESHMTPTSFLFQLTNVSAADIINAPHDWRIIESGVTLDRDGVTGIDGNGVTENPDAAVGLVLTMLAAEIQTAQADGRPLFAYVNVAVTDTNRAFWEVDGVNWIDPDGDDPDVGTPTADAPAWLDPPLGSANGFGPIVDFTDADWRAIVVDQIIAQLEAGYQGIFLDDVGRYDELTGFSAGDGGRMMMETVNAVVADARQIAATRSDLDENFKLIINSDPYIASNFYFSITDQVADGGQGRALTNDEIDLINTFMANVDGILTENAAEFSVDPWQVARNWFNGALSGVDARFNDTSAALLAIETADEVEDIDAVFAALEPDVLAFLSQDQAYDTYIEIPQIGTDQGEMLVGGARADALVGLEGDDNLSGNAGADVLYGGAGNDTVNGGNDGDVIVGGGGNNTLRGQGGDDDLRASDGDDALTGGIDNDTMDGGAGMDDMLGQGGDDSVLGGAGEDILRGGQGNDTLDGGADDDDLYGQGNNDLLMGDAGNDTMSGAAGADTLDGGSGDDRLTGGNGADRLAGGRGDDVLNGGANADVLIFGLGDGNDTIAGFEDNLDSIEIAADLAGGQSVAQILADMSITSQVGGSVVIDFGGGDVLQINSVAIAALGDDMSIV